MNKLKLLGIFVVGLLVGGALAYWYSYTAFKQMFGSKEAELAFRCSEEANWLAGLRLNQTERVIKSIEQDMDWMVLNFPQWDQVVQLNAETQERRDHRLVAVKLYHESYPPVGEEATKVKAIIANVAGRSPESTCSNWVCQLEDLRLQTARANTNAPAK